jgi:excisionase family DNA binding protein
MAQVQVEVPAGRWLQVKEVARMLDLHPVTVRRKIRRGELPAYRLGPKGAAVRVDRTELEQWLALSHVTPAERRAPAAGQSTVRQLASRKATS